MAFHYPVSYGPTLRRLLEGVPPAPLDAGRPNEPFRATLATLTAEGLWGETGLVVHDAAMAKCCLAGLWLRHNFFDESHALSQEVDTPTGSFWHGILHRREPDYSNARYWFRRIGAHPVLAGMGKVAGAVGGPTPQGWDAMGFVKQVEEALQAGADSPAAKLCGRLQQMEWELLFDFSWRQAAGDPSGWGVARRPKAGT